MSNDRRLRRRVAVLAGAALVLVGATAPSSCQPPTKPTSTLLGSASHSSIPAALADPPCPVHEDPIAPVQGSRQKWGFRITAADPTEWLSLRPCLTFASGALTSIEDTGFTIYTSSGDVHGTAAGVRESLGSDIEAGVTTLRITGGTKAYRSATGTLYLLTCQRGSTFVHASIRATSPGIGPCERFVGT